MKYIIYKITNIKNGKIYIGKHQTKDIHDSYFGSGIAIERAIKKYGKKFFLKEILHIFDNESEMNLKEKEIVTEEFISTNKTYNIGVGGQGGSHFKGKKHSEETKQKLREIYKPTNTSLKGEKNGRHKLKDSQVLEIKEKVKQGISREIISKEYKINKKYIYFLITGKRHNTAGE